MGASLSGAFVNRVRDELRDRGIDGWLLYDFRGNNRVAADLLGMPEGQKRRYFVLLGADGVPTALVHRIELSGWDEWEYRLESYVGWEEMEAALARLLEGAGSVAMEVSDVMARLVSCSEAQAPRAPTRRTRVAMRTIR